MNLYLGLFKILKNIKQLKKHCSQGARLGAERPLAGALYLIIGIHKEYQNAR